MMDCNEFVELVTAFLDGALAPVDEARFVEHIAICEGCERYLDQFRVTIARLGELPPETLSTRARNDLLTAFRDWHNR
ncbi:zf-HC2 domain-containing protein [Pseudonocardia eucalypti]|uniref:Zf-HC2 domain-containing protein n=1 Tax=Pseudonocardia eucalypti TaxID=648755 RepID=A0ABP9PNS0_9PSEU|nr:putative anti-sigma-YlaC factor YlaD [Pseudonocardia eucalypti]